MQAFMLQHVSNLMQSDLVHNPTIRACIALTSVTALDPRQHPQSEWQVAPRVLGQRASQRCAAATTTTSQNKKQASKQASRQSTETGLRRTHGLEAEGEPAVAALVAELHDAATIDESPQARLVWRLLPEALDCRNALQRCDAMRFVVRCAFFWSTGSMSVVWQCPPQLAACML